VKSGQVTYTEEELTNQSDELFLTSDEADANGMTEFASEKELLACLLAGFADLVKYDRLSLEAMDDVLYYLTGASRNPDQMKKSLEDFVGNAARLNR
jgi:hypothetical protein